MDDFLESRARLFADDAHRRVGQVRKYTNEPYITHPAAVVELLRSIDADAPMLAAAWLHDTVEDTDVTLEELEQHFGPTVARYVSWLTDRARPQDGNRAIRKAIERSVLALAPAPVQSIKVADLIDNGASIQANDPTFAKVYLREKEQLLEVLVRADVRLLRRAGALFVEPV
jgi:(p)ppGpp synthase/HD superfamily hydrolase